MKRTRTIWIGFAICLAVVLVAMGFISATAVRADRAKAAARLRAAQEERVGLALWRMDSTLAPLVAQESARPYFAYSVLMTVDRPYARMFNGRDGSELLAVSPLLDGDSTIVEVHFQFEPDGTLTSPQTPEPTNDAMLLPKQLDGRSIEQARAALATIESLTDRDRLLARLPASDPKPLDLCLSPLIKQTTEQRRANRKLQTSQRAQGRAVAEHFSRNQVISSNFNVINQFQNFSADVGVALMTPLWIEDRLILARRIRIGEREYVQGCLLNWPGIKELLLESVDDLLSRADLTAALESSAESNGESRMLASLPARLVPGAFDLTEAEISATTLSPVLTSLVIAWACVLLAAGAVAVLLAGVMRLSEHRADFVTAVTHELRTPLTTFQIYAEMLAEGMVADKDREKEYLRTLQAESVRLTHMVENVLSYARLERGRADGRIETIPLDELLEPMVGRLGGRAEQAGMALIVASNGQAGATAVRVNRSAAEQILFNLVDNACKYAASAENKRIELSTEIDDDDTVWLRLRDRGPGVEASARRRLFGSFSKTASEAAQSAPGVGLGLALSRRLARDMGGDLTLDESVEPGACFVLALPRET